MHVTVRTKVFAATLLPVLVLSAVVLAGVIRLSSATAFAARVNRAEDAAATASLLRLDVLNQQAALKNMMLRVTQPVEYARQSAIFDDAGKQATFHRETLGHSIDLLGANDLAPVLARFDAAYTAYSYDSVNALRATKAAGGPNPINGDAVVRGSERDSQEALDDLVAGLSSQATATRAAQVTMMRSIVVDSLIALALAATGVLVAGWLLARRIGNDVNDMAQAALRIVRDGQDPVVAWPGALPHTASSPTVGPIVALPANDSEPVLPAGFRKPAIAPEIGEQPTAIIAMNLQAVTRDLHQATLNLNDTGRLLSEALDGEAANGAAPGPADSETPKPLPRSVRLADKLGDESRRVRALIASVEDSTSQAYVLALRALADSLKAGGRGQEAALIADAVIRLAERSTQENDQLVILLGDVQESADRAVGRAQHEEDEPEWDGRSADDDGSAVDNQETPLNATTVLEPAPTDEPASDESQSNSPEPRRIDSVRRTIRRRHRRIHPAA